MGTQPYCGIRGSRGVGSIQGQGCGYLTNHCKVKEGRGQNAGQNEHGDDLNGP